MNIPEELLNTTIVDVYDENTILTLAEMPYKQYLKTKYWNEVKKKIYEAIGNKCEVCGTENKVHIHHFNYDNRGKETYGDIVCLCENCHSAIHQNTHAYLYPTIFDRNSLEKAIADAKKLKKKFDNKKYIRFLPLTKKSFWTIQQIAALWDENINDVKKLLDIEKKNKLILTFSVNDEKTKIYCINYFIWYLIELDFPKIPDCNIEI